MLSISLLCLLSMAASNVPTQEECPCVTVAKELGVKGETFDRLKSFCDQLGVRLAEVDDRSEVKKLGREVEAAAKAGDGKKAKSLRLEQARLYKPAIRQFHEEVRALFEADQYRAFKAKLPPFFQPFPETLRSGTSVTEELRYAIPADRHEEFRVAWRKALVLLGQSSHCIGQEITQCVEDPRLFAIRIQWDSVSGHEQNRKSADHAKAHDCVKAFDALLTSEVQQHYRTLD
jgi:hypothetical protein